MEEVVHADIFFFITSAAVILLTVLFAVALVYAILILHRVHAIVATIRKESDSLVQDLRELRGSLKEEGMKLKHFFSFIAGVAMGRTKRRTKRETAE